MDPQRPQLTNENIYDNIQMLWEVVDTLKEKMDRIERALPAIDQDLSFNLPETVAMLAKRLWKMQETVDKAISNNESEMTHVIEDLPATVEALNDRFLVLERTLHQHPVFAGHIKQRSRS